MSEMPLAFEYPGWDNRDQGATARHYGLAVTLSNSRSRQRFGQTIIANFVGCALVLVGIFTTPILVGLGFVILVVSLGVRLYALVTSKRRNSQGARR